MTVTHGEWASDNCLYQHVAVFYVEQKGNHERLLR
jgi:hypothetical protein